MKSTFPLIAIVLVSFIFPQEKFPELEGPYLGQKSPGMKPELFAPGIISTSPNEYSPFFSPDGKEVYFSRNIPKCSILYMKLQNNRWTKPLIAPFSGKYIDGDPFISPDGKKLYFGSNRPADGSEEPKDDFDIWVVEKTESGWSEPENLGSPVNSNKNEIFISISGNGTIFYGTEYGKNNFGHEDIYCTRIINGSHSSPENLGVAINTEFADLEPFIAPDESYIIFVSYGRPDGFGGSDLYFSVREKDGSWSKAVNMGEIINSRLTEQAPLVSPDGRYLFFTSDRAQKGNKDIYWIEMKSIKKLLPYKLK